MMLPRNDKGPAVASEAYCNSAVPPPNLWLEVFLGAGKHGAVIVHKGLALRLGRKQALTGVQPKFRSLDGWQRTGVPALRGKLAPLRPGVVGVVHLNRRGNYLPKPHKGRNPLVSQGVSVVGATRIELVTPTMSR